MGKLEISVLIGAETKQAIMDLADLVERLEACMTSQDGEAKMKAIDESDDVDAPESDEDEDFTPKAKKTKVKAKASFDVEEDEESEDEADEVEMKASKKKAPKLTIDDVNDACKAKAQSIGGKEGRQIVLGVLKKKFKTTSVSELKPEQYALAIAAMEV